MSKPAHFTGSEQEYETYQEWLRGDDATLAKLAANRLNYRPPAVGPAPIPTPPPPSTPARTGAGPQPVTRPPTIPAVARTGQGCGGCGSKAPQQVYNIKSRPRPTKLGSELVIARYNENISWLNGTKIHATVYNKGHDTPALTIPHTLVQLPNIGREANTWLTHILTNYDTLADWTYLLQGDALNHQPDLFRRIRHYDCPTCLSTRYTETIPPRSIKDRDKVWVQDGLEMRLGDARVHHYPALPKWFNDEAWGFIFVAPLPQQVWFCYSAQWALPRAAIRCRPRKFYEWLQCNLTENGDRTYTYPPLNPWSLEALWNYIWDHRYHTRIK